MADTTQPRFTLFGTVSTLLVLLWVIVAAFPFLWTVWGSFKVESDFFSKADWTNRSTQSNEFYRLSGARYPV